MKRHNVCVVPCLLLAFCTLIRLPVAQATTVYFNTTSVGTTTFHGTSDSGGYPYWQYNIGQAPVSVVNQTVYLTLFSPAGNDCNNQPAPLSVNILTYGPGEPIFGTYGLTVPPGFGFSLPTFLGDVPAIGGCYVTYAFDGVRWPKPHWSQGDWVAIETGGIDLATDPAAAISAPYNGNAVDVNVRGAWACMTDDGNYAACLTLYHFAGFQPPVNADGSGVYNFGRTLPVKFHLTDLNGDILTTATANIVVTVVQNGVVGPTPVTLPTSRFALAGDQYIYNLDTSLLAKGTWQIKVVLDDGTSYAVLISLR